MPCPRDSSRPRAVRVAGLFAALPALALLLFLASPGLAAPYSPAQGLASFDQVDRVIAEHYYDPTFGGVDWDAWCAELRPRAAAAGDIQHLRGVLWDLLLRLPSSHVGLLPAAADTSLLPLPPGAEADRRLAWTLLAAVPRYLGRADPGIDARILDGEAVVWRIRPGSPADRAGVRPGWIVRAVAGRPLEASYRTVLDELGTQIGKESLRKVERRLRLVLLREKLSGRAESRVPVTFEDGGGERRAMVLTREDPPGAAVKIGGLPALHPEVEARRIPVAGGTVGLLTVNVWVPSVLEPVRAAMDTLRDAAGLVLDLRGNPGGDHRLAGLMAGYFLDRDADLGTFRSREASFAVKAVPGWVGGGEGAFVPFEGPVAILTDGLTASTSEILTAGLKDLDRARQFGEPTAGALLLATVESLPDGDGLLYPTHAYRRPDGEAVEGKPLKPDDEEKLRRKDLLEGRDRALEAAVKWIVAERRSDRR